MTTGRPSFLKMVGGLLVYPLYAIQVSPDSPTRSASSMHELQHDSFMPTDVFVVSVISVFMSYTGTHVVSAYVIDLHVTCVAA